MYNLDSDKEKQKNQEITMFMSFMFLLNKVWQILGASDTAITVQAKLQKLPTLVAGKGSTKKGYACAHTL